MVMERLYKASTHQELGKKTTQSTSGIDSTRLTIIETIDRTTKYPSQSPQDQEPLVYLLQNVWILCILTVEEPGFVSMLNKLNPKYQCPTQQHFQKLNLYCHVRNSKVTPKLGRCSLLFTNIRPVD